MKGIFILTKLLIKCGMRGGLRKGIFILTKLLIKCGMRGGLSGREYLY